MQTLENIKTRQRLGEIYMRNRTIDSLVLFLLQCILIIFLLFIRKQSLI